jgi:carbon monoxide dehydrogenase subunit G
VSYRQSVSHSEEIRAPLAAVWDLLTDWAGIIDWMPDSYIRSLRMEGRGEGAVRHLVTGKGVPISEKLVAMDPQRGILLLSIIDPLPWGMLSYSARAQLEDVGEEYCRLSWCGTFELPAGGRQADELTALLKKSYATMFKGIVGELERISGGNDID